jgi:hypothetical protein
VTFLLIADTTSSATYAVRAVLGRSRDDSWFPMLEALRHLRSTPDAPLYSKVFFGDHVKFQYPISSLLLPDLMQRVSGASWAAIESALNKVSWVGMWITAGLSWALLVRSIAGADDAMGRRDRPLLLLSGVVAATLMFYPMSWSVVLGQIQTLMTLLLAAALLAYLSDKKLLAGVCIGLCCSIKPHWAVVLLWAASRRDWAFAIAGGATASILMVAAGALYGFIHYVDYVPLLSFLSEHGESVEENQSINGVINRALGQKYTDGWSGSGFPAYHPLVHAVTVSTSAVLILAALAFRWRSKPTASDFALVVLSVTIASPIAWTHHYAVLLPILALVAPAALRARVFGRRTGAWLVIAFILASHNIPFPDGFSDPPLNLLRSYVLFSAFAVLVLLYRLAKEGDPVHAHVTGPGAGERPTTT